MHTLTYIKYIKKDFQKRITVLNIQIKLLNVVINALFAISIILSFLNLPAVLNAISSAKAIEEISLRACESLLMLYYFS